MTTKPNTNNTSDYSNNYFCIPNEIHVYELDLCDMIVNAEYLDCAFQGSRISVQLPSNDGLRDYGWLAYSMEQKLIDMGIPFNKIRIISRFFAGIEEEVTEKILKKRGYGNYIE